MRRIYIKRVGYILIILTLYTTSIFGASLQSPNYTLIMPRIVSGGGSASSQDYLIKAVSIGEIFGGVSTSSNYSLDVRSISKIFGEATLNRPILDPVTTPTNLPTQTLTGKKAKDTAIYINGYERVPLDDKTTWSYDISLQEGDNFLIITSRNKYGLESESVTAIITLDTIPPIIIINNPIDATLVFINPITVEGTIDGVPFTQSETLIFGPNPITVDATDNAGNASSKSVEVYFIREPLAPPQTL